MAAEKGPTFRVTYRSTEPPSRVFPAFVEELGSYLRRLGWSWSPRKGDMLRPTEDRNHGATPGRIVEWNPDYGTSRSSCGGIGATH
jgi:hypothetical protein